MLAGEGVTTCGGERENARGGRARECEQLLPNKATV